MGAADDDALEMQVARWMDRAAVLTEKLDAITRQAHVWRRQVVELGGVPVELEPPEGKVFPAGSVEKDRGMEEIYPDFPGPGDAIRAERLAGGYGSPA